MNVNLILGRSNLGDVIQWNGIPNWHAYITGASGFGKTYELRSLAAQVPDFNGRAIIFDYSGDFVMDCPQQDWPKKGSNIINIRSKAISLNPFIPQAEGETDEEIAERVVSILSRGMPLGTSQWAYLYDVILTGLSDGNLASIADLAALVESDARNNDTAKRILPKIKIIGRLLPSGTHKHDWMMNVPGITIIDLSSIKDPMALTVLVEMLLWGICSDRMNCIPTDPPPLVLILDECQRLRFKDGDTTIRILREGRKYGIWGWFSTQWIDDKNASNALGQAAIRIVFRPEEDNLHSTALKLARRDPTKVALYEKCLGNLKRGQFLLQTGSQIVISRSPAL